MRLDSIPAEDKTVFLHRVQTDLFFYSIKTLFYFFSILYKDFELILLLEFLLIIIAFSYS